MIKQEDDGFGCDETPNGSMDFSAMPGFKKERSETTKSFKILYIANINRFFR